MRRHPGSRGGFTLVEAIATMAILAAMGSVASSMIFAATRSYTDAVRAAQLQDELSIAMEQITRELRALPEEPGSDPAVPSLSSVTGSSLLWNTDYSLWLDNAGQILLVEDGGAPIILLRDVTILAVAAFDEAGTPLATPLVDSGCHGVRRIQIQITVSRAGVTQSLRSKVYLRGVMQGS